MPALATKTVRDPLFYQRAEVAPSTWSDEDGSVEVLWSGGEDVLRYDWRTGTEYWERLDFNGVDLRRLNSGRCACLDSHNSWSGRSVIGVVPAARAISTPEGPRRTMIRAPPGPMYSR